ncbi:MAG: hypothetical protein C0599_12555 [Salinivirgaceae bacterium]|nr:MAG: hypothetical protein C0599_12555 [Salinivirgaceae bacterium]
MKKTILFLILTLIAFTIIAQNQLTIEGDQIWVRSTPKTGEVIMKLDDGVVCDLLQKGEEEIIRGHKDYWYKIENDGKTGWVFGAQTSLKRIASIDDIELFLDFFLKTYYYGNNLEKMIVTKNWKTSHFAHPDIGVFRMYNPGVACVLFGWQSKRYKEDKFLNYQIPKLESITYFANSQPKDGFCEESDEKDGVYYKTVSELPKYPDMSGDYKILELPVPTKYKNGEKAVVRILSEGCVTKKFYFIVVEGKWRLVVIDDCDCSA